MKYVLDLHARFYINKISAFFSVDMIGCINQFIINISSNLHL